MDSGGRFELTNRISGLAGEMADKSSELKLEMEGFNWAGQQPVGIVM